VSLINQMLRDLESRQHDQPGGNPPAAVYEDLAAVPRPTAPKSRKTVVIVLIAGVLVLVGYFGWRYGMRSVSAPVPSVAVATDSTPSKPMDSVVAEPAPRVLPPLSAPATPVAPETIASTAPRATVTANAGPRRPAATPEPAAGGDITKVAQPPSPQEQAAAAYQQAVTAIRAGRSAEADEMLRRAVHLDPRHTAAREALVGLLLQQGHGTEAEALLEEGIGVTPQYYRFAQLAARLAVEQGAEARALAVLERSAPHARQDPEYQAFYAALLQRAGRHEEAARNYQQALDQRPLEGRWWLGLAIALESQQRLSAAADAYKRSLQGASLDASLRKFAEQRLAAVKSRKE
jgi:MSHA biogenesis protein MshN